MTTDRDLKMAKRTRRADLNEWNPSAARSSEEIARGWRRACAAPAPRDRVEDRELR